MTWEQENRIVFALVASVLGGAALLLALCLVVAVASMRNEKHCLEAGYPRTSTTWDLQGYCMNLEGSVTVTVDKLP